VQRECREILRLEEIIIIVTNATRLAEEQKKRGWTDQQVDKLKMEAQTATMELTKLRSNTTLLVECAHLALLRECRRLNHLTIIIVIITNTTSLTNFQKTHNLTATEVTKLKNSVQNFTMELNAMQKNTTLVQQCKLLNMTKTTTMSKTTMPTMATTKLVTTAMTMATTKASTVTINTAKANSTVTTMPLKNGTSTSKSKIIILLFIQSLITISSRRLASHGQCRTGQPAPYQLDSFQGRKRRLHRCCGLSTGPPHGLMSALKLRAIVSINKIAGLPCDRQSGVGESHPSNSALFRYETTAAQLDCFPWELWLLFLVLVS
jgi:hypothetical protein